MRFSDTMLGVTLRVVGFAALFVITLCGFVACWGLVS